MPEYGEVQSIKGDKIIERPGSFFSKCPDVVTVSRASSSFGESNQAPPWEVYSQAGMVIDAV
jgi:hypothetical protein